MTTVPLTLRLARWADRRFMAHVNAFPSLAGETREEHEAAFNALSIGVKLVACTRVIRSMPYALVVLAVSAVRPALWSELEEHVAR